MSYALLRPHDGTEPPRCCDSPGQGVIAEEALIEAKEFTHPAGEPVWVGT